MKSVSLVVPGPLATRTGGSIYDCRIADGLRARGWAVSVIELDPILDPLTPPEHSARGQFATIPDESVVLVDGLAFGTMPAIIEAESRRLRFVPVIHMVLSTSPGLTAGESAGVDALERRSLVHARHIVVTGTPSRDLVRAMVDCADDRITRIPPGVDRGVIRERPSNDGAPLRLLCVANVTWGKGYDILLRALAALPSRDWSMRCVGSLERDRQCVEHVRAMATELGLDSCITWTGEATDSLEGGWQRADLFVLATRGETYGMAVAEAISHGLPVVSTRTGEIATIVGVGGFLAEPGDAAAFASMLHEAVGNRELRQRLRAGARVAASRLPTWDDAADAMDSVLNAVASQRSTAGPMA